MTLTDNLVAYWKMDEASGSRADSVGSYTLTDNNTCGSRSGIISSATDFIDTNTEFLSLADNADMSYTGAENRSLQFWFNPDSVTGVNTIMSKWANTTDQEWLVYLNGSTLTLGVLQQGAELTKASITTGAWWHVVVTMNSSKGLELFVNGTSAGTKTSVGTVAGTGSEVRFGQNSTTNFYDGAIDEAAFWTRVITSTEVTQLYNAGAGLAYPFTSIKTVGGLAKASVKTVDGLAIASVKTIKGLT